MCRDLRRADPEGHPDPTPKGSGTVLHEAHAQAMVDERRRSLRHEAEMARLHREATVESGRHARRALFRREVTVDRSPASSIGPASTVGRGCRLAPDQAT